ncbi:MAG: hypothetical protein GIX03_15290 [Candidatus Eremiobacteraeota bacterium]|nr:hypothetical protein [Candidatus Eremiobacteraeota bacterium]MBC5804330.1 hypothetical protein [Candidatus Eremiobacteraeota bacterium]MBC5822017.1 hypothetical protein [Candidatus Eremiobacteraeota bacterium]
MDVSDSMSPSATVARPRMRLQLPFAAAVRRRASDVPEWFRGLAVLAGLLAFVVAYVVYLERMSSDATAPASAVSSSGGGSLAYRSIDDAQSAGSTGFQFVGGWQRVVGEHDGRLHGTSTRSFRIGATATLVFVGRSVRVYGVGGPNGGTAAITLDGRSYGTASFATPRKQARLVVFDSPPLAPGTHRLSLIVAPPAAGSVGRGYVNIDGAAYQP